MRPAGAALTAWGRLQARLVSLRAGLFFAVNEQLAPAVHAMAAGVALPAVLAPALPPVPSIADMLHVRASKPAPQPDVALRPGCCIAFQSACDPAHVASHSDGHKGTARPKPQTLLPQQLALLKLHQQPCTPAHARHSYAWR